MHPVATTCRSPTGLRDLPETPPRPSWLGPATTAVGRPPGSPDSRSVIMNSRLLFPLALAAGLLPSLPDVFAAGSHADGHRHGFDFGRPDKASEEIGREHGRTP